LRDAFYKYGTTLTSDPSDIVGGTGIPKMVDQIKEDLRPIYNLPLSIVVASMNIEPKFRMYHKSAPLVDAMRALVLKDNVYSILCSVSDDKEKMLGDLQNNIIITQWDAMTFLMKNEKMKVHKITSVPARQVMQRSWITFTKKDDPNQLSHSLTASKPRSTFALSITKDMTAFAGFKVMAVHSISSVAVVDKETEQIKLIDNLSASDIKHVSLENIHDGFKPVTEFLHQVRDHPKRIISCNEDTSLEEVVKLAMDAGIQRVWVEEKDTEKPLGVITMSDMLGMFVGVEGDDE